MTKSDQSGATGSASQSGSAGQSGTDKVAQLTQQRDDAAAAGDTARVRQLDEEISRAQQGQQ